MSLRHLLYATIFAGLTALSATLSATLSAAEGVPAPYRMPAEVTVTTAVAAPNPGAWTATFENPPVENLLAGGEYEGFNFRWRCFASNDGVNTIPVSETDANGYDCRREGFFDGATARVYRIVSGAMTKVGAARIAKHRASGWLPCDSQQIVPTGSTTYQWNFDGWNSPVAPYWFSVVAVGANGVSAPAKAVRAMRSKKCELKAENSGLVKQAWPTTGAASVTDKALPTPTNLQVQKAENGRLTFTWDPVTAPGVLGYLVLRSDYDPAQHHGYGFDLEPAAKLSVRKGDLVYFDLRRDTWSRNRFVTNRVWGDWGNGGISDVYPGQPDENPNRTWELVPHPQPIPSAFSEADRGRSCLKVTMRDGEPLTLAQYNHAGPEQNWYPVLQVGRTYVIEFWARQTGMSTPTLTFGASHTYEQTIRQDFTLDNTWKHYRYEFSPDRPYAPKDEIVGRMLLSCAGPGTLWLDCWRIYPQDVGYASVPAREVEDLKASGMGFLRTHAFIKSGWSYFLDDLVAKPGVQASRGNASEAPISTLASILAFLKESKTNPWLQIEMSLSEEEWQGLVEYLAAPYDPAKDSPKTKPWAAKRYAMGQTKPWTDEFPKILFEVSNETWNPHPGFAPWNFPWLEMPDAATGRVYKSGELTGLTTGYILAQMKKSPYWPALSAKIETVACGWLLQLDDDGFGQSAVRMCHEITYNLVANYNGGWDEGAPAATTDDVGRRQALTVCPQYSHGTMAQFAATRDRLAGKGLKYAIGTYEAGPGYSLPNTITKEQEEAEAQVMKSLAAGTGTLDCFLDGARQGLVLQNFFTYSRGRTFWTSHAPMRSGGQAYPSWMALSLWNRFALGDVLVTQDMALPTDSLAATKTRPAMAAASLAGIYATRQGNRVSVFVLSRKLDNFPYPGDDGYTPVTLHLPFSSATKVTRHVLAGDPRAHNLDRAEITVKASELPATAFRQDFTLDAERGTDARGLPPAATFLYVFEGVTFVAAPKDPVARILPGIGQPTVTTTPEVRFRVLFDRKVEPFTADKLTMTAPLGAKAVIVWPTELAATGCEITVGGFEAAGAVSFTIPGSIACNAEGKPLTSPVIQYRLPATTNQVLAGDSFDRPTPDALWSATAAGWNGAWVLHNTDRDKYGDGYAVSSARPLAYPGLLATPAYLTGGMQYQYAWRNLDVDGAFAGFTLRGSQPALVGLPGRTLWLGVVVRKERNDGENILVSLNADAFYKDELVFARCGWSGQKNGEQRVWSLQVRSADSKDWQSVPTTVAVEIGKPALLMIEARFAAKPVVNLYVNPPLGAAPSVPSATAILNGIQAKSFSSVVLSGGSPGSSAFDEIRLSDSFAGAAPAAR